MAIRISGLNSGMDTESMVQELVKAYSSKTDTIKKDQTRAKWKQEAYGAINTKIKNFSNKLSNLQYSTAYSKKKTNISDESKVSVLTGDNAVKGTQTVAVNKLAKSGYLTGGEMSRTDGGKVTADTTLGQLGYSGEDGKITIAKGDGSSIDIGISADTKISDVTNLLSNAGVNANFDSATGRIFVSSKESGAKADFNLTSNSPSGKQALAALGLSEEGYNAKQGKAIDFTNVDTSTADGKPYEYGSTKLSALNFASSDMTSHMPLSLRANGKEITVSADDTIDSFVSKLKDAGIDAAFDEGTKSISLSGESNISSFGQYGTELLNTLGIGSGQLADVSMKGGATKIDGQDAEIKLNGATFTSSTNTFNVNGLTITAKDVTEAGKEVTLNTDTDYDGIYDTIKDFIKEYDSLINELDKLYNADTAKGYDPLTSEEKEALTEDEVEEWEKKIKDSLLRRDESISSVASTMKNAMSAVYEVGGQKLALSNFGIETLGYFESADNEKNAYHIAGDKDDAAVSGQTDKMRAAIANDPEQVANFFQKLTGDMYESFRKLSSSSSSRTFGNFYDDKKVKEDYEAYETKLSDWEDYVAKIEDKYYKQFSAMETAMSKLNSQQSYVQNMFGM